VDLHQDRRRQLSYEFQFMITALLLIAHGSRREEANADLPRLAEALRQRGGYPIVVYSYLELAEPTIEAAAKQCVEEGAHQVLLLPYFLSAGLHVTRDLQAARDRLRGKHATVRFDLCEPVGLHPMMMDIVLDRARQAEQKRESTGDW
jgi:sirohydrochlorin ferrochelatase